MPGAVIAVVDNGSTDGSAVAIASRYPDARLFVLDENRGFTGGIAAALKASTARNVIFLNNDAVPEPGWLAALTRAIDDAPDDVMSVAGKIIDLEGKRIDFIGGVMTFDGHAFQNGFRFPLGSAKEPAAGAELLFACGGNMISRRAPLVELGGFDDDYFAYLEDVDFGWRSWIAGYRVLYEPRAVVRHASSATSDRIGSLRARRALRAQRTADRAQELRRAIAARHRRRGVLHVPASPSPLRDDAQRADRRAAPERRSKARCAATASAASSAACAGESSAARRWRRSTIR